MKTSKRILCLLMCLLLTLFLGACAGDPPAETTQQTTEAPTTAPQPTPAQLYSQAAEAIGNAENLKLQITAEKTVSVGRDTFNFVSTQTLVYAGIGTDQFCASLDEMMRIGEYYDTFQEYYRDGELKTTVFGEYHFKGKQTQEEFLARFVPAVMFDIALYADITATERTAAQTISFSGATAGETWALPEGAEMKEASGAAVISIDGVLLESSYTITYAYGGADITAEYEVKIAEEETSSVQEPDDSVEYTELTSIMGPRLLDTAMLPMMNSQYFSTTITEAMVVQAADLIQMQSNTIHMHGADENMLANIDITINRQQNGQMQSYHQVETYRDGSYYYTVDDGKPSPDENIDHELMLNYCITTLGEQVNSLSHIQDITVTDLNGVTLLEIKGNEAHAEAWLDYVCETIFEDKDLLDSYATAYNTVTSQAYFAFDPCTGLPTAVGVSYAGTHTIDGYPYAVSCQIDQAICVGDYDTYEEITGERPETQEPENKATPLFYHVTGTDGQEMWLFGTIHIGDERTSYLPQEIYDAFDASDALAVEFNTRAFEEAAEDPEVQEMVTNAYFYTDGTVTASHISSELYATALKYMKASGNHNMNVPMLKVSLWSNFIDNFYLQQQYRLRASDGVDNQLLIRAEKSNKPIYDVESAALQINMMGGYSDELQEYLLKESIEYPMLENHKGTAELFELWCQGDEEALRKEIANDLSELTEEEKPLYEEYIKAMETDRNVGMLEVAKEYLESDEVVFYAVGLAHLLAEDGLVNTLRDAGYTVELVNFK